MAFLPNILAAISALFIGFLWYNPKVFGTAWMKGIGMTEEKMASGNMALRYGLAFLMALFISVVVGAFADHTDANLAPAVHGIYHGASLAGIVALPILVTNSLFEQQDFKTIAINVGYWIVTMSAMGAILTTMAAR